MSGASEFSNQLKAFQAKVEANSQRIFVNTASAAKDSITDGSTLTGAPGQPVNEGTLKAGWILEFPSPTLAHISTSVPWAPQNEDGIARPGGGPYVQRSPVGGRHSVKLTILNIDRLLDAEVANVVGA